MPKKVKNSQNPETQEIAIIGADYKPQTAMPVSVSFAEEAFTGNTGYTSKASTRRNRSATVERTDAYTNLENGMTPFKKGNTGNTINASEAIGLCQKAYYNIPIFYNTIEL